jgi:hypothetical protein
MRYTSIRWGRLDIIHLPSSIIDKHLVLSSSALSVLCFLCSKSKKKHRNNSFFGIKVGQKTLAASTGLSKKAVLLAIKELEAHKYMSRLSWKWRRRSFAKIAERTYEKRA